MNIETSQIRSYRLHAHHLDRKLPAVGLEEAAGACGLQNSPPGAWETALFNRLEGCTLRMLEEALYEKKELLQAWSFRGAPAVFPTAQSDVFLTALLARPGEQPWIYTMGITAALDFLGMPFDDLLLRTKEAAKYLDGHTVRSKEALDRALAGVVEAGLPEGKTALWRAPSMYGHPDRQTVGAAAVSFLLRPCSFSSLVVFGERQGISPTFTSLQNWTGSKPAGRPDAERELARKFLHCYGPATVDSLMDWLGCSRQQARRIWGTVEGELESVSVGNRKRYLLAEDMEALLRAEKGEERLILLGAHDPYLDMRDRDVILDDPSLQRAVWKTVANPGAVIKGGRVIGIWRTKTQRGRLMISVSLFEAIESREREILKTLAGEYASFRRLSLGGCEIESLTYLTTIRHTL